MFRFLKNIFESKPEKVARKAYVDLQHTFHSAFLMNKDDMSHPFWLDSKKKFSPPKDFFSRSLYSRIYSRVYHFLLCSPFQAFRIKFLRKRSCAVYSGKIL